MGVGPNESKEDNVIYKEYSIIWRERHGVLVALF